MLHTKPTSYGRVSRTNYTLVSMQLVVFTKLFPEFAL